MTSNETKEVKVEIKEDRFEEKQTSNKSKDKPIDP